MDDDEQVKARTEQWERKWSGFLWAVIGFGAGTGLMSPFILAIEPRDQVIWGMIYGGIPLALAGAAYGLRRAKHDLPLITAERMPGMSEANPYRSPERIEQAAPKRRWLRFSPLAVVMAMPFALPGIALALIAKPFLLGDGGLLIGVLLAFGAPICWLTMRRDSAPH